jgi:hypothetical protein
MFNLQNCIFIVVIIIVITLCSRKTEENLLKGFWCADGEFCEKAELEMFILYIGDNVSLFNSNKECYLLAANEQGVILNNACYFNFSGININPIVNNSKEYNINVTWKNTTPEDENAFPKKCQLIYYPYLGKIVIKKNKEVIAILWKNSQMSAVNYNDLNFK